MRYSDFLAAYPAIGSVTCLHALAKYFDRVASELSFLLHYQFVTLTNLHDSMILPQASIQAFLHQCGPHFMFRMESISTCELPNCG